jgi:hypothetical protein
MTLAERFLDAVTFIAWVFILVAIGLVLGGY